MSIECVELESSSLIGVTANNQRMHTLASMILIMRKQLVGINNHKMNFKSSTVLSHYRIQICPIQKGSLTDARYRFLDLSSGSYPTLDFIPSLLL